MMRRVMNALVVDDEPATRRFLREALAASDWNVEVAQNGTEGFARLSKQEFDLVFTDLMMPGMDGMELVRATRRIRPHARVVLMTGHATIETAVQAMREGAADYITKPVSLEKIDAIVHQMNGTWTRSDADDGFGPIKGRSPAMQRVYAAIRRVASTDSPVLIEGESGTGKELVARAIFEASGRKDKPFVALNCCSLPETLLSSELFGHEAGAFTGATHRKIGLVEQAHNGTLFLDEISETSNLFQKSLLRVLQEGELVRVGGLNCIKVDVRIIAATNKKLEDEVKKGAFREDLYYRLNVVPIKLPPLRERREDIPLLAKHFLAKHDGQSKSISDDAMSLMTQYDWPGNVRELENVIRRAIVLSSGEAVDCESLLLRRPAAPGAATPRVDWLGAALRDAKMEFEKSYLRSLLGSVNGNVSKAARIAKVGRPYLHEKIRKYNIEADEFRMT